MENNPFLVLFQTGPEVKNIWVSGEFFEERGRGIFGENLQAKTLRGRDKGGIFLGTFRVFGIYKREGELFFPGADPRVGDCAKFGGPFEAKLLQFRGGSPPKGGIVEAPLHLSLGQGVQLDITTRTGGFETPITRVKRIRGGGNDKRILPGGQRGDMGEKW